MTPERRALKLLELLYRGGGDASGWPVFNQALCVDLGGAALVVATESADWENPPESYWVGLDPEFAESYRRHAQRGLPWGPHSDPLFRNRFCRTSELLPDEQLAATPFYREWMQPQGLVCEGPLVHAAPFSGRRSDWMLLIFRAEGSRAFEDDDLALCNLLAPHMAIGSLVFDEFARARRERVALSEVVDRIPAGILVLDATASLLLANLGARRLVQEEDGLALKDGHLKLEDPEADADLRKMLEATIGWRGRDAFGAGGEMWIERPSGKRSYIANIVPMNAAERDTAIGDDVAVVLLSDPEADQSAAADRIKRSYKLTDTETDLIRMMAEGFSLEAISLERGVTMNTTRTHLKHVFSKTGTRRQGELVGLVLSTVVPESE